MNHGQRVLMTGAVLGSFFAANIAHAQIALPAEKWACTSVKAPDQKQQHEFSLHNGELIAQPLGAPRYQVLDNTQYGIIAVDRAGDLDPLYGFLNIYVATVMIDRRSGFFTTTLSQSGHTPVHETGSCRKLEANAASTTVGSAAAEK